MEKKVQALIDAIKKSLLALGVQALGSDVSGELLNVYSELLDAMSRFVSITEYPSSKDRRAGLGVLIEGLGIVEEHISKIKMLREA